MSITGKIECDHDWEKNRDTYVIGQIPTDTCKKCGATQKLYISTNASGRNISVIIPKGETTVHHESETGVLQKLIQDVKEKQFMGATGKFPGGKLTSTDEGEIAFGVSAYKGKVVVNFGKSIASIGFSPEQAREFALLLRQHANDIERNPGL